MDWEIQNIGFHNWMVTIRGTLLRSDYLIKKSEYESAKSKEGISKMELNTLEKAAKDADEAYKKFLENAAYAD